MDGSGIDCWDICLYFIFFFLKVFFFWGGVGGCYTTKFSPLKKNYVIFLGVQSYVQRHGFGLLTTFLLLMKRLLSEGFGTENLGIH